jgi:hypothetical protein
MSKNETLALTVRLNPHDVITKSAQPWLIVHKAPHLLVCRNFPTNQQFPPRKLQSELQFFAATST